MDTTNTRVKIRIWSSLGYEEYEMNVDIGQLENLLKNGERLYFSDTMTFGRMIKIDDCKRIEWMVVNAKET